MSQYLGAALAVLLFARVAASGVAWMRVLSAAVVLLAWRRPALRRGRRSWWLLVAFGTTLAAMNLCFYEAISRIPVGSAVAVEFAGPVTVAALGSRRRQDWLALGIAVAGVLLVADVHLSHRGEGVALAGLAGVLWAGYIVLGARVARAHGAGVDALALAMAAGALAIAPFGAVPAAKVFTNPPLLAAVIGVGLLSSVVPYGLDQVAMRRMPRHRYALTLALLPATAAVVGAVVLGQLPGGLELLGIALVMASLVIVNRTARADPGP